MRTLVALALTLTLTAGAVATAREAALPDFRPAAAAEETLRGAVAEAVAPGSGDLAAVAPLDDLLRAPVIGLAAATTDDVAALTVGDEATDPVATAAPVMTPAAAPATVAAPPVAAAPVAAAPVAAPAAPAATPVPVAVVTPAPTPAPVATPAPTPAPAACPETWFCYPRLGVAGGIVPYGDCLGSTDIGTGIRSFSCLSDFYLMGHAYTQFGAITGWQAGDVVFAWGRRFVITGAFEQNSCEPPARALAPLSLQTSLTSSGCGRVLVVQGS